MDDKKIMAMFQSMDRGLTDDSAFLDNMKRNLDFVQQAKERNDRMVKTSRKRLMLIVLAGIALAAVIVALFLYGSGSVNAVFTTLYAVVAASLCSAAMLVYGLLLQRK